MNEGKIRLITASVNLSKPRPIYIRTMQARYECIRRGEGKKKIKTMNGSVRSDRGINTSKSAVLLGLDDPSGFRMTARRSTTPTVKSFASSSPLSLSGRKFVHRVALARSPGLARGAGQPLAGETDAPTYAGTCGMPTFLRLLPSLHPSIPLLSLPLVHTQFYIFPLARAPACRLQR